MMPRPWHCWKSWRRSVADCSRLHTRSLGVVIPKLPTYSLSLCLVIIVMHQEVLLLLYLLLVFAILDGRYMCARDLQIFG
jgi:membrane protein required for beta-lactamase induction